MVTPAQTEAPQKPVEQIVATTTATSSSQTTAQATTTKKVVPSTKVATSTKKTATTTDTLATTTPEATYAIIAELRNKEPSSFRDITLSNQNMRVWLTKEQSVVYAFIEDKKIIISYTPEKVLFLKDGILR